MLKIFRYLKDNILSVILIILLLIVQANCDLTIPQYTSNIINVGVQQGGIEEVNPEVVRKSKLDEILLFVSDKEKEEILSNYELVTEKSDEHDYDILSEEPVYVIKDEEKSKKLEEMYRMLVEDKQIKEYFDLEVKFNIMIADVNKIIAEAIKDVL